MSIDAVLDRAVAAQRAWRHVPVEERAATCIRMAAWLVAARTRDRARADLREILEARFFPTHSLPEPLTPLTRTRIEAWRGKLH